MQEKAKKQEQTAYSKSIFEVKPVKYSLSKVLKQGCVGTGVHSAGGELE